MKNCVYQAEFASSMAKQKLIRKENLVSRVMVQFWSLFSREQAQMHSSHNLFFSLLPSYTPKDPAEITHMPGAQKGTSD